MNNFLLISGIICSVILLGVFIYLQKNSPNILKVPAQWIAVAALPIIVVLFAGGYIDKFSGFGIVLESTLKSPIEKITQVSPVSIISDASSTEKTSVAKLRNLSLQEKLSTRYLRFVEGRSTYIDLAIAEYFKSMPNLYFIEVVDSNGNFICLIPIDTFVTTGSTETYNREQISTFVTSLASSSVLVDFAQSAITTSVSANTDLISVLKTMKNDGVKYIGIVGTNGKYLGVAIQSEIEHKIADSVLAQN